MAREPHPPALPGHRAPRQLRRIRRRGAGWMTPTAWHCQSPASPPACAGPAARPGATRGGRRSVSCAPRPARPNTCVTYAGAAVEYRCPSRPGLALHEAGGWSRGLRDDGCSAHTGRTRSPNGRLSATPGSWADQAVSITASLIGHLSGCPGKTPTTRLGADVVLTAWPRCRRHEEV